MDTQPSILLPPIIYYYQMWDVRVGGKAVRSFQRGHTNVVTSVVASSSGRHGVILSGSLDGSVIRREIALK